MRKTIEFKKFSIDLTNQWKQLTGKYNWITYNWVKLTTENDKMHGCFEVELYLLGFGIRFYWVSDKEQNNKAIKKYDKIMKSKTVSLEEARDMLLR